MFNYFSAFDIKQKGYLSQSEFNKLLLSLDDQITKEQSLQIGKLIDSAETKQILYEQFWYFFTNFDLYSEQKSQFLIQILQSIVEEKQINLYEYFSEQDGEQKGYLNYQQFKQFIKKLTKEFKTAELDIIFQHLQNNDKIFFQPVYDSLNNNKTGSVIKPSQVIVGQENNSISSKKRNKSTINGNEIPLNKSPLENLENKEKQKQKVGTNQNEVENYEYKQNQLKENYDRNNLSNNFSQNQMQSSQLNENLSQEKYLEMIRLIEDLEKIKGELKDEIEIVKQKSKKQEKRNELKKLEIKYLTEQKVLLEGFQSN